MPFAAREGDWEGELVPSGDLFVTGAGSGTTYPDYKPAPFIVSAAVEGVDMVTVVTEAIFSYCGVNVKIDTDRHIGAERQVVRARRARPSATSRPASTGRRCSRSAA